MRELSLTRKKLRLASAFVRGYPIWCSWQVTYACNFRCSFCSYWKEEVNFSREARSREAGTNEIRSAATKLAQLGSLLVNLAGGEPLLRRDLAEIVAAIAQQHFAMVTTNGSLVTEARARELWQAGLFGISVSLDFDDPQNHDANRGFCGAAARAREALRLLSRTRSRRHQRVNLACVLTDRNLADVEPLIRFAAENGCTFTVQPYTTIKNGHRAHGPEFHVAQHLLDLRRRYPNFISHPHFLRQFDRFFSEHGIPGCKAGRAFFNVDNFLNVQKCVEFRYERIGNLRELEPRAMVRRLNEESQRNRCKACWYNCRGETESLYTATGLLARLPALTSLAAGQWQRTHDDAD